MGLRHRLWGLGFNVYRFVGVSGDSKTFYGISGSIVAASTTLYMDRRREGCMGTTHILERIWGQRWILGCQVTQGLEIPDP